MGLQATLTKENNTLYADFTDAYWKVTEIRYTTNMVGFDFSCYASREASKHELEIMSTPSLSFGGANRPAYEPVLYRWLGEFPIVDIFPTGIPLDENAQKTAIYNFIKRYTGLPFTDVFEE